MKNHLNKSVVVTFFLILGITDAFCQKNDAFQKGEELLFKVTFGFFDAAEAKMVVNPRISSVNNQPSYKIDVYGQTLGIFKLFKVNDNWGSYLDTAKIIPHRSYRHIEEGKYRKHEQVFFDHDKKNAKVKLYDRDNLNLVDTKDYKVPENVQDIVSGFYYLRTMNLNGLKKGDQITLTGFFDKEIYNLKLIYGGKEVINTRLGSYDTFIFSPLMPKNKIFRGEQPVTVWITDDRNKIPIKIKAKLMVGSLHMEIMDAKGLRNN
jgi:hypothetical protein